MRLSCWMQCGGIFPFVSFFFFFALVDGAAILPPSCTPFRIDASDILTSITASPTHVVGRAQDGVLSAFEWATGRVIVLDHNVSAAIVSTIRSQPFVIYRKFSIAGGGIYRQGTSGGPRTLLSGPYVSSSVHKQGDGEIASVVFFTETEGAFQALPDGTSLIRLGAELRRSSGTQSVPVFSPDNTHMAAVINGTLYVARLGVADSAVELSSVSKVFPGVLFSRDSQFIAAEMGNSGSSGTGCWVQRRDDTTGSTRLRMDRPRPRFPACSPLAWTADDQRLLMKVNLNDTAYPTVMSSFFLHGAIPTVAASMYPLFAQPPMRSFLGQVIPIGSAAEVFYAIFDGVADLEQIFRLDAVTEAETVFRSRRRRLSFPSSFTFSEPGESHVVFVDESGALVATRVDGDGTQRQTLTAVNDTVTFFLPFPSGERFATLVREENGVGANTGYVTQIGNTLRRALIIPGDQVFRLELQPNSVTAAYLHTGNQKEVVFTCIEAPVVVDQQEEVSGAIPGHLEVKPTGQLVVSTAAPLVVAGTVVEGNGTLTISNCASGTVFTSNWVEGSFGSYVVEGCGDGCTGTVASTSSTTSSLSVTIAVTCSGGLSKSAIIGIAVGCAVGGVLVVVGIVLVSLHLRNRHDSAAQRRIKGAEMTKLTSPMD